MSLTGDHHRMYQMITASHCTRQCRRVRCQNFANFGVCSRISNTMKFVLLKIIQVEFPSSTVSKCTHDIPRVLAPSVRRCAVLTTLYSLVETLFANCNARSVLRFRLYETMKCRDTQGR